ncbi:MAG: hypothetical protein IT373_26050 [Polyangiaceae bacterium]|nr:hypothetical protein [Polyangiaceae bacterium]
MTATPAASATAPVLGTASAPLPGSSAAPTSERGGFDSAEALSKAVVAALDAHDEAAARALYPGDAVIDAFATCKAARNLKSRLKLRRDAGLAGGKDEKLEWLALDRVPSPKRRKKGAEKDGCVFKEEIAIYALRVRVNVTKGKKPKKKWKKLDAIVFEGRWYLASEI